MNRALTCLWNLSCCFHYRRVSSVLTRQTWQNLILILNGNNTFMFENNRWLWQTSVGRRTWSLHVQSETISFKMLTLGFFRRNCCRLEGSVLFPHPDLQATIKMLTTLKSKFSRFSHCCPLLRRKTMKRENICSILETLCRCICSAECSVKYQRLGWLWPSLLRTSSSLAKALLPALYPHPIENPVSGSQCHVWFIVLFAIITIISHERWLYPHSSRWPSYN